MIRKTIKLGLASLLSKLVPSDTNPDITQEDIEQDLAFNTDLAVEETEEVSEPEKALFTSQEIFNQLKNEAVAITKSMEEWKPSDEILEAIIPELEILEGGDSAKLSEACLEIQEKYLKELFLDRFMAKLLSLREDVAAIDDQEELFKHYLYVAVFQAQLVQIMAAATQVLISMAFAHKKEKENPPPTPETPSTNSWGISWTPSEVGEA